MSAVSKSALARGADFFKEASADTAMSLVQKRREIS